MDKLLTHIRQGYNNQPIKGQSPVARSLVGAFLRPFRSRWNPIAPSKAKDSSAKPLWTAGNKKCPKNPSTIDRPAINLYCRTGSKFEQHLHRLSDAGNLRIIPSPTADREKLIDLSSNDYLGIAENRSLIEKFFSGLSPRDFIPTSSASRLLALRQNEYNELENTLVEAYRRPALLFNSGYHANVGVISALADKRTLFLADKLVHASIIDGLNLAAASGARFMRFRHNDYDHLRRLLEKYGADYDSVVIVAESVYSMDGDMAEIDSLVAARDMHPRALLYIDEAHAVGVVGSYGLGATRSHPDFDKIDIVVGTFGKALASSGAFVVTHTPIRQFLVNTARSFIFSTSLPPIVARWSREAFLYAIDADAEREQLHHLGIRLQQILGTNHSGHIQPLIVGDAHTAVTLSDKLRDGGIRALPIRTPTVPAGTERIRFSLSAALTRPQLDCLERLLHDLHP